MQQLVVVIGSRDESKEPGADKITSKQYFGQKCKFNIDFNDKNFDELYTEFNDENQNNNQGDSFVQQFRDKLVFHQKAENSTKVNGSVTNEDNTDLSSAFPSSWLHTQCEIYLSQSPGSLSVNDLTMAVFEILRSVRSSDEIQNELFDLMGFEAFDLIQQFLEQRQQIVQVALEQTNGYENNDYQHIDPLRKHSKPVPGSQVTIQVFSSLPFCFSGKFFR